MEELEVVFVTATVVNFAVEVAAVTIVMVAVIEVPIVIADVVETTEVVLVVSID